MHAQSSPGRERGATRGEGGEVGALAARALRSSLGLCVRHGLSRSTLALECHLAADRHLAAFEHHQIRTHPPAKGGAVSSYARAELLSPARVEHAPLGGLPTAHSAALSCSHGKRSLAAACSSQRHSYGQFSRHPLRKSLGSLNLGPSRSSWCTTAGRRCTAEVDRGNVRTQGERRKGQNRGARTVRSLLLVTLLLLLLALSLLVVVLALHAPVALDAVDPRLDLAERLALVELLLREGVDALAERLAQRRLEPVERVARDGLGERTVLRARRRSASVRGRGRGSAAAREREGRTSLSSSMRTRSALTVRSSASSGTYSLGSSWHHSLRASSAGAQREARDSVSDLVVERREGRRAWTHSPRTGTAS